MPSLEEVFKEFRRNRSSLSESLYTEAERSKVSKFLTQTPALIVTGQTNCGKSSIINEFLGARVVPTKAQPCTARIVRMTYSETPYVRLVKRDGTELERRELKSNKIPREFIELNIDDRDDEKRVNATVEAGLCVDFLKAGIDVIDSPGTSENDVLDELVRNQMKSILPFVIYVVDGHNLLSSSDIKRLNSLRDENPDMEVFFVVSKIEPAKTDSSDEESDDDDNDESVKQAEPVQESKKRKVYDKLVKKGFIIPCEGGRDAHPNFHGLSAWRIGEFNKRMKMNPAWDDSEGLFKEYMDAFHRLHTCLHDFTKSSLTACVENTCNTLTSVLSRCLSFFIKKANFLKQGKKETMVMINRIRQEELTVHENILRQIEKQRLDITEVVSDGILEIKSNVLEEARTFQYSELDFVIPANGWVHGAKAVTECRDQIWEMVFNKVRQRISSTLMAMFSHRDEFLVELENRIKKIEQEAFPDGRRSTAGVTIHLMLVNCYEVSRSNFRFWTTKTIITRLVDFLKRLFKFPLDVIRGKVKVGDMEWKERQASVAIEAIDVAKLVEHLMQKLLERFDECHSIFNDELDKVMAVFKQGQTLKDSQRQAILKFAPDVSSLEMLCYCLSDRIKFGKPEKGELIGTGAQGNVYECTNITTREGKPCVVKEVSVPNENTLKDLTLELHTTRNICHPNILPLVCTVIQPGLCNSIKVLIVSERMASDLHRALPRLTSLRKRLEILLDVARALKYLHSLDLIHRDVKLQNVLVDEKSQGSLTDFGLCKAEGVMENSLVGTPTSMAPEMVKQNYNKSVDVYAFGILMWRVCEGQGNQPRNIALHPIPIIMLVRNALEDRKPERLDRFMGPCWNLMERCWATVPDQRPNFQEIESDLQEILLDKTIQ